MSRLVSMWRGACGIAFMGVCAHTAAAQDRAGLPTLAGAGLNYLSPSGVFQIDLSGQLDLEAYVPQDTPPWLIPSVDPFIAGRFRLFTDIFAGQYVYALVELRADRGEAPAHGDVEARLQQVFVRVTPVEKVQLQAGRFALPFGSYAERHHTVDDAFIRPPLAYDYRTLVSPTVVPAALSGFLDWKNDAQARRAHGAPAVWNVPYPWGAMLSSSPGRLALRTAVTSAAPSSSPEEWHRLRAPSYVLGASIQVVPELRLGLAWNRGPYLADSEEGVLPLGTAREDYVQEIWNAEAVFRRGRTTLRAELFLDRWEVPNLDHDPRDVSWYVESRYNVTAGLFVATRWNETRFNRLPLNGSAEAWDHDVRRLQMGAGYRFVQNAGVRAEYVVNRTRPVDPRDDLFAVQWWWAF